jgi:2-(1,2-epoxy-1,2-dihydrophenyl)acetyl-CoA isomerase
VPDDQLAKETRALAGRIAAGPLVALRFMKKNLNRAETADLRTCLAMEADRMSRCLRTQDAREAVRAFMEKRRPVFGGGE